AGRYAIDRDVDVARLYVATADLDARHELGLCCPLDGKQRAGQCDLDGARGHDPLRRIDLASAARSRTAASTARHTAEGHRKIWQPTRHELFLDRHVQHELWAAFDFETLRWQGLGRLREAVGAAV